MNVEEKAVELVKLFKGFEMPNEEIASKQCAQSAVSLVMDYIESKGNGYYTLNEDLRGDYDFYEQVYNELGRCL